MNEALETRTVYVDAVNGKDTNPGTLASPYATIATGLNTAVSNNRSSLGTLVIVNPGTYREDITLNSGTNDTSLPITLQAATTGTAIVNGAIQMTGWTPYSKNTNIYTNSWNNNWGVCASQNTAGAPAQPDIMRRRELVMVNGTPMTQVLALADVIQGTFYVDESLNLIYLWPISGVSLSSADIEVGNVSGLLTFNNKSNFVVRGMTFEYDSSCRDGAAVTVSGTSSNFLFDSDTFLWNNAMGLKINYAGTSLTVQNSLANHNGQSGFHVTEIKNSLFLNLTANYNNWRGAQGTVYNWNVAGFHSFEGHSETVTNLQVAYNQSYGTHWDTDHKQVTVTATQQISNLLPGDFWEKSEGPITITGGITCYNGLALDILAQPSSGLAVRNSENFTLTGNVYYDNGTAAMTLEGSPGGLALTDWETNQTYNLVSSGFNLQNNLFNAQGTQSVFLDVALGGNDWTTFLNGQTGQLPGSARFSSNLNTWWNPDLTTAFLVPSPASSTTEDFAAWKSQTGQDPLSFWAAPLVDPAVTCAVPIANSSNPDFWFVTPNPSNTVGADGTAAPAFAISALGTFKSTVNFTTDTSSVSGLTGKFSPTSVTGGSGTTTLTLTSTTSAKAGTYQIPVFASSSGTVRSATIYVVIPTTSLRFSTSTLNFPATVVGTSSALSFTINNFGTKSVTGVSFSVSGDFSQTNNCTSTIKAGATCTITVTLTPGSARNYQSTFTVTDSDKSSPQKVSLTGVSLPRPSSSVSPGTLSYGTVKTGSSSSMTATLQNTSTTSPLTVTKIFLTGSAPSQYSQTSTCPLSPATLAALATCTSTIKFVPTVTGLQKATLEFDSNIHSGATSVTLTGTGSK